MIKRLPLKYFLQLLSLNNHMPNRYLFISFLVFISIFFIHSEALAATAYCITTPPFGDCSDTKPPDGGSTWHFTSVSGDYTAFSPWPDGSTWTVFVCIGQSGFGYDCNVGANQGGAIIPLLNCQKSRCDRIQVQINQEGGALVGGHAYGGEALDPEPPPATGAVQAQSQLATTANITGPLNYSVSLAAGYVANIQNDAPLGTYTISNIVDPSCYSHTVRPPGTTQTITTNGEAIFFIIDYTYTCGGPTPTPSPTPPPPPPPPGGDPAVNLSCSPSSIPYNTSANVSWSSSNVSSCTISPPGWTGTSDSKPTGNLTSSTTYTATCTPSSAYTVRTFTSSGTFTVPTGLSSVEVLVVSGGGQGGGFEGGGGGGGGITYRASYAVSAGNNIAVTVGAGGTGATSWVGAAGGASSFGGLTAPGGGGASGGFNAGGPGGSGGGGSGINPTGNSATAEIGNAGGSGGPRPSGGGGGGGGSAGSGGLFPGGRCDGGGAGGTGYLSSISGVATRYAGGGGGAGFGPGGSGGGGNGGHSCNSSETGTAGAANTGGGGGGRNFTPGLPGGSGIVIVKYLNPQATNACTITVAPPPAPTADIKANGSDGPITIPYNGSVNITWCGSDASACANATSCTTNNGWTGTSGSQSNIQTSPFTYVLSCLGPGGSTSNSVTVNVSSPTPNNPSNITVTAPDYCVSGPAATVGWTYSDPSGSPQSAYEVQMDEEGSFQVPEYQTGKVLSNSNSNFTGQGVLLFNKTYKTRVRVWNGYDVVSGWTVAGGNFNTPPYAYPQVDFSWTANGILNNPSPPLNKPVDFTDATVFNGNPNGRRWSWTFGDGGTSTLQNPSRTYVAEGSYYVTLTATDNANQTCARTKGPLIIQKPIPKWREVAPQ